MESLPAGLLIDPARLQVSDVEIERGTHGTVFAGTLDGEPVCCRKA
jgi:hypothetical protein